MDIIDLKNLQSEPAETLLVLQQENIQLIMQPASRVYGENSLSLQRCSARGEHLLAQIEESGMTDELDQQCAVYIEKTRRTIKEMNKRRSPFTQLFDRIRFEFTGMENTIDPAKKDSVPYLIQQQRNAYAARKRQEEERARQEEMRRQQRQQAIARYTQDAEDDYRCQFDGAVTSAINELTGLNQSLTVENFDELSAKIKNFRINLGDEWFQYCQCHAHKPYEINDGEAIQIRQTVLDRICVQLREQYAREVGEYRDTIADALPSKKHELERIAQASAEEQKRIKADLAAREAAETARLDQEHRRKEEEAAAAKKVQQTAAEVDGLFSQAAVAVPVGYQPKTAVRKRIAVDNPEGMLAVVSMWWSKEGRHMPLDELMKIFKKQLTFCEKLANDKDNPEMITSPFIRYEEEVKAK